MGFCSSGLPALWRNKYCCCCCCNGYVVNMGGRGMFPCRHLSSHVILWLTTVWGCYSLAASDWLAVTMMHGWSVYGRRQWNLTTCLASVARPLTATVRRHRVTYFAVNDLVFIAIDGAIVANDRARLALLLPLIEFRHETTRYLAEKQNGDVNPWLWPCLNPLMDTLKPQNSGPLL